VPLPCAGEGHLTLPHRLTRVPPGESLVQTEVLQTKHFVCSILPSGMTSLDRSDDNDLLVALRHPLRRRILRLMGEREVISPLEMEVALDKPLSNVSYHVRVLLDCAAVTLVKTAPKRGSVQHFYCTTIEAPWALEVLERDGPEAESAGESPDS